MGDVEVEHANGYCSALRLRRAAAASLLPPLPPLPPCVTSPHVPATARRPLVSPYYFPSCPCNGPPAPNPPCSTPSPVGCWNTWRAPAPAPRPALPSALRMPCSRRPCAWETMCHSALPPTCRCVKRGRARRGVACVGLGLGCGGRAVVGKHLPCHTTGLPALAGGSSGAVAVPAAACGVSVVPPCAELLASVLAGCLADCLSHPAQGRWTRKSMTPLNPSDRRPPRPRPRRAGPRRSTRGGGLWKWRWCGSQEQWWRSR